MVSVMLHLSYFKQDPVSNSFCTKLFRVTLISEAILAAVSHLFFLDFIHNYVFSTSSVFIYKSLIFELYFFFYTILDNLIEKKEDLAFF